MLDFSFIARGLLDAGADVEAKADSGLSPIHCAISSGDPGLVEMLLDHNAAITLTGQDWNFSVLHRVDNVEICRLLTDRGVDWKTTTSTTIFTDCWVPEFSKADRKDKHISDEDSDADTAEDSDDESDAEMEAKVWESRSIGDITVAHVAVWKNRTDVFEFLMDNISDIDVNIPAEHGLRPLHLAAIGGRLSFTTLLLSRNANPNVVYSPSEWTPLHFAARVGSEQVVCELLDHGGDPGALDSQNRTPSLVTWEFGHRNLSKMLKDKEIKTLTTAETKAAEKREPQNGEVISNALMSAIRKGDAEWCRQLVDYGCNVNGVWTCSCSPLVIACRESHWEVAKYFTSVMQSVRGKTCAAKGSSTGYDAIHYAAGAGQHQLLNQLLEKDEFPPKVIVEAFRLAALSGTAECLRLLHKDYQDITTAECNRGCCVDWTDHVDITLYLEDDRSWESHECYESTCLHYAVHLEVYASVRFLLEIGANLEAREVDGATPLIFAMENDSLKMMEILLHSGANVNARNNYGLAPLLYAAIKGTPDMLRLLVQYGVDLSIRDERGRSALHLAFEREDETMAEALIELGMDPLCQSDSGEAALQCGILNPEIDEESLLKHLPSLDTIQSVSAGSLLGSACFYEREAIVGELLKRAPQSSFPDYVNTTSPLGTPLYAAACAGNLKLTEVLLEYGTTIDLLGGSMGTPLLVACEFGRMEVVKLLLKRGAKLSCEGADQLSMTAMCAARSHKDIKIILQRFMDEGIESLDSPLPVHIADINKLNEIYTTMGERDAKEAQEKAVELQEDAELEKEAMQELEAKLQKFVQTYGQSLQPLAKEQNPMILFLKSLRHDTPQIIVEEVESDADSHHSGELKEDQNSNKGVFVEDTYKGSKSEDGWNSESDESEVIDRENLNQLADQILRPYEESIRERQASQMLSDGSFLFEKLLGSSVEGSSATRLKPDTTCQVESSTHVCVEMEVSWESISSSTQRAEPVPEFKAILSTPHEIHESSNTPPLASGTTQDRQERRKRKKAQIRRVLYREISKRIG
ncbi:hypothetical protein IFR05_012789 [Cadophora sp. M221]|nr:hypothetical protein IFR05_012789 [Cadophora sp. M221]